MEVICLEFMAFLLRSNQWFFNPVIWKHWCKFWKIQLYGRTTDITSVNKLRESMFPNLESANLPPTQDALLQHLKRAIYPASIWLQSTIWKINAADPCDYGWKRESGKYFPLWMTLPPVSNECNALLKCGCKSIPLCSKNCKYKRVWILSCTHLCFCKGQCI